MTKIFDLSTGIPPGSILKLPPVDFSAYSSIGSLTSFDQGSSLRIEKFSFNAVL